MRRIVVSTFITLDGVMESPEKWSFDFHDEQNMSDALGLLQDSEALLLGRTTYDGFAEAWPARTDPMGFADKMNSMPKYVVSSSLVDPTWAGTIVLDGDAVAEVRKVKEQPGGDLLVYGSATLTRTLLAAGLVDELRLLVSPVVVGEGRRLFDDDPSLRLKLETVDAVRYPGGMTKVVLRPQTL